MSLPPVLEGEDAERDHENSSVRPEDLFLENEGALGRFLVQMVRDRSLAEDLLQDVFCDALRDPQGVSNARNPRAWLFGIAKNHALTALRKKRRFDGVVASLVVLRRNRDVDTNQVVELLDLLDRHLDPDDRALVLLTCLHGLDSFELAELTGRSDEAVRKRISRARRVLVDASSDSGGRK